MSISTEDLNFYVDKIAELRAQEAQLSMQKKVVTEELESVETRMLEMLMEAELKSYRAPMGLVSVSVRSSVKIPRDPEQVAILAKYLRDRNKYDLVFKPNSASLNALWKEEFEAAKEAGADDYNMPGIEGVTVTPNLSFRKA